MFKQNLIEQIGSYHSNKKMQKKTARLGGTGLFLSALPVVSGTKL